MKWLLIDYFPILIFFAFFLLTLYSLIGMPSGFEVDSEYINGILTASSILFGFWAVILGKEPKEKIEKHLYKYTTIPTIFIELGILLISVIIIFLSAMKKAPSVLALICVFGSFLFNVIMLVACLYSYSERLRI